MTGKIIYSECGALYRIKPAKGDKATVWMGVHKFPGRITQEFLESIEAIPGHNFIEISEPTGEYYYRRVVTFEAHLEPVHQQLDIEYTAELFVDYAMFHSWKIPA